MKALQSSFGRVWAASLIIAAASLTTIPYVADAATSNTGTNINSVVGSTISMTSNGTVNINLLPTGSGVQTTASDSIQVSTNNTAGYTLQLAEATASTAMVSGGNSIPAVSGTPASPVALTANKWGYRVDGLAGFGAGPTSAISNQPIGSLTYAAVAASGSPYTLKNTSTTGANDLTTVWYSMTSNTTQPSGTYTNAVTYTATTN